MVGASFILLESVDACESKLSVVEDGCVVRLTTEQFKTLLAHIRNASPLQLRIGASRNLPSTSASSSANAGALITLNWTDEPMPINPTTLHVCILHN